MTRETRIAILKDIYQDGENIADEELYDEAIATIENYFDNLDEAVLYHRSRIVVIAYLALLEERKES